MSLDELLDIVKELREGNTNLINKLNILEKQLDDVKTINPNLNVNPSDFKKISLTAKENISQAVSALQNYIDQSNEANNQLADSFSSIKDAFSEMNAFFNSNEDN